MQISRKQLRYIYNRFTFKRPSFAYYPVNSATPGKRATYGEARVGLMTDGRAGVLIEEGTTNLVPLAKQKFVGWTAYSGAAVTLTQGVAVPEWGASDATRIQTSGGTNVAKYYVSVGITPSGAARSAMVWVKNIGTTAVSVYSNAGAKAVIVNPGESKLVKLENCVGDGVTYAQLLFRAISISDSLDFIAWRPMYEDKTYCTSFTDGTRSPETISAPVPFTPQVGGEISFIVDVNDACKRQVAGVQPRLLEILRADNAAVCLGLWHYAGTPTFAFVTKDDAGNQTHVDFADSLLPNGTRELKIKQTPTAVILYCDGVEITRINSPKLPSGWGRAYFGSDSTSKNHAGAMFGGVKTLAADSTVLSDILFNGPDFVRKARTIQL